MAKKLSTFFGYFLLTINLCTAQINNWSNKTDWTLYDTKGAKFYNVKVDNLNQLPCRKLNNDSMQVFLNQATVLPSNKIPQWMGAYVVSYTYEHRIRKIDISTYSGFFYDESSQTFFQIDSESQKGWHDYLALKMNDLLSSQ
jgi:hypothetical protein